MLMSTVSRTRTRTLSLCSVRIQTPQALYHTIEQEEEKSEEETHPHTHTAHRYKQRFFLLQHFFSRPKEWGKATRAH